MELILYIQIKFLQVDIIVFDGIGQTCQKYPIYFYCDAKQRGSSHVHCYLFLWVIPRKIFFA